MLYNFLKWLIEMADKESLELSSGTSPIIDPWACPGGECSKSSLVVYNLES